MAGHLESVVRVIFESRIAECKASLIAAGPIDERCAVCLDIATSNAVRSARCHHVFHRACVEAWIERLRPPDRLGIQRYVELEHPERYKRELACPVCCRPFISKAGVAQSPAVAEANDILASFYRRRRPVTVNERLDAVQNGISERPTRRDDFPALSSAAPRLASNWRAAIDITRHSDEERRARRIAEARDAATAARTARLAACEARGLAATYERLTLADDIVRAGARSRALELRAEARAAWPQCLLDWARRDPKTVAACERAFRDILANPDPAASRTLPPQRRGNRKLAHALAAAYGFRSESYDKSPHRHLRIDKCPASASPSLLLSQAADRCDRDLPPPILKSHRRRRGGNDKKSPRHPSNRQTNDNDPRNRVAAYRAFSEQPQLDDDDDDPVLREALRQSLEEGGDWCPAPRGRRRTRSSRTPRRSF